MEPRSDSGPGFGVVLATFAGFAAIVIFTAAIGSYIGRHSTPEPVVAEAPAAPAATPPAPPAPPAMAPAPAPATTAPSSATTPAPAATLPAAPEAPKTP